MLVLLVRVMREPRNAGRVNKVVSALFCAYILLQLSYYRSHSQETDGKLVFIMKPMRTRVVRTIHPVGQGAFYSERFYDIPSDELVFTVVYDCGSGTGRNASSDAKSVIGDFICELDGERRPVIDVLFISHFHSDHINGIKELVKDVKIKNIIMPYMKRGLADKLQMLQDKIYNEESLHTFANPYNFFSEEGFGETHLIYVVSDKDAPKIPDEDTPENRDIHFEEGFHATAIDINRLSNGKGNIHYFKSGNLIAADNCLWLYMPFTRKDSDNDTKLEESINELNKIIKNYEMDNPNYEWISNDDIVKDIKKKYKEIDNRLNNTSMLVFSAPISLEWNNHYEPLMPMNCHPRYCYFHYYHEWGCRYCDAHPSCLYTGDISLEKSICDLIAKNVQKYRIGAMQVPHHGANNGWLSTTMTDLDALINDSIFFMSFGLNNQYEHPHKDTLYQFKNKLYALFATNEMYSTKLEQHFINI